VLVALAGLFSGVNELIKWVAGRTRPYKLFAGPGAKEGAYLAPFELHPFRGGSNMAFPSGHAALAFATAAALAILMPRWRWAFYGIAALTAAERVLEGAHYPSDVVAAAALGVGAAHAARAAIAWHARWYARGGTSQVAPER